MKKQTFNKKTKYAVVAIISLLYFLNVYGCGGGVVPYVPTQSGASGASTASSQFFIFEKGVAIDMFDIKKHQPIFRNIILTGNERKVAKIKAKTANQDSTAVSTQKKADSTSESSKDEIIPILNIHRLH